MSLFIAKTSNRFYWAHYVVRADSAEQVPTVLAAEMANTAAEDERANAGNDLTPSEHYVYDVDSVEPLEYPEQWHVARLGENAFALIDSGGNG